jgi:hypothetical protein
MISFSSSPSFSRKPENFFERKLSLRPQSSQRKRSFVNEADISPASGDETQRKGE